MKKVEILVRAIIQTKGKILVCKRTGKKYYFFPGGHVDFGESTKEALVRELKEELGLSVRKCSFIGLSEHLFTEKDMKHHEINLAFWTPVRKVSTKSKESHLQFFLMDKNQIRKEKILPIPLTKAVLKWLKDKKPFWAKQI